MSRTTLITRFVLLMLAVGALALLVGGEPWGPN
jgi:hypothetical protein